MVEYASYNQYKVLGIIYFKTSKYKKDLLDAEVYDEIKFEGRFKDYSDFTGFIINDAVLIKE